jgi:hypothetical protein
MGSARFDMRPAIEWPCAFASRERFASLVRENFGRIFPNLRHVDVGEPEGDQDRGERRIVRAEEGESLLAGRSDVDVRVP